MLVRSGGDPEAGRTNRRRARLPARHFPEPPGDLCTSLFGVRAKMSTEEQKPQDSSGSAAKVEPSSAPPAETAAKPPADVDAAVAWPPPEAAPTGEAASASSGGAGEASKPAPAEGSGPGDSGVMTAPETSAA